MQKSMAAEEGNLQERQREMEPLRQRAIMQALQPPPERPKLQQPPQPPKQRDQHDDENWLFAAGLLGSLAGALTRRHATNALAAFSGAMEGYQEGSRQKFDQSMKLWEAENKKVQETNKSAMDEYREILENRKLDMSQMSIAMQLAGQKYDDKAAIQAAKTKNSLIMAQFYDKRAQASMDMEKAANNLLEKKTEAENREMNKLAIAQMRVLGVSPGQANDYVTGIANYDIAPPTGVRGAAIMNLVKQENPAYDQKEWARRLIEAKIPAQAAAAGATARERVLNTAGARTEITLSRAGPVLTNASEAANRVPATEFKRINQLYQAAAEEISDPAVRNFKLANEELAGLLAAVNNPQSAVITVSAYEHARELIIAADGPDAYHEVLENIARLATRENANIESLRRGEAPAAITIPPVSANRRASVPELTGKTVERTTGAVAGAAPGSVGRVEPSGVRIGAMPPKPTLRSPMSPTPDMPILQPGQ